MTMLVTFSIRKPGSCISAAMIATLVSFGIPSAGRPGARSTGAMAAEAGGGTGFSNFCMIFPMSIVRKMMQMRPKNTVPMPMRTTNSLLYSLAMGINVYGNQDFGFSGLSLDDRIFLAQSNVIRKIAEEGACVIVGRCADYALADFKNVINLFIFANEKCKIERVMKKYDLTEDKAREMMIKKDKQRQSYYNYYSSKKWGRADSYDLCINSSVLGVDGTVKLISQYVEDFETRKNSK